MRLTFVNVGYGEAMVLECPDPARRSGLFVMVIDGGGNDPAEFADRSSGRIPMADYLARRGLDHIDVMVSTHIHEDHISGLLPLLERWAPRELWQTLPAEFYRRMRPLEIPEDANLSRRKFLQALNDYQILCARVEEQGGVIRTVAASARTALSPELSAAALAPSAAQAEELAALLDGVYTADAADFWSRLDRLDARMNNFSLMLRLDFRGTGLLLPGDTNCLGYDGIPAGALQAHLFKVGHHGQRDGVSLEQLRSIAPAAVVCCASSDRRYNSADPGVLAMAAESGARLYFSDCPPVPGAAEPLPPHHALEFTVGPGGMVEGRYLPL